MLDSITMTTMKEQNAMLPFGSLKDEFALENRRSGLGDAIDANSEAKSGKDSHDCGKKETAAKSVDGDLDDDVALTFPQRLMEILDNEEHAEIIAWLPHGRGFVIYRKKAFEQKILPKYFNKSSKYSSFTRKLNRWGFCRVTRGPESGAYYHRFFTRGGHRLVMQMSCQSSTKTNSSAAMALKSTSATGIVGGLPMGVGAANMMGQNPLYSGLSLHSAAAEQAVVQQQQQLLQMQMQQQMYQQEMVRRAMANQRGLSPSSQPQQQLMSNSLGVGGSSGGPAGMMGPGASSGMSQYGSGATNAQFMGGVNGYGNAMMYNGMHLHHGN